LAASLLIPLRTTVGSLLNGLAKVSSTKSPTLVLAPATIVIVPLVSLPVICTVGAGMLFNASSDPAAIPVTIAGALPAVII
jgi:hypothetical protein